MRRSGFTLAEMIVAMALLVLMMAAIASIFAAVGDLSGQVSDQGTVLDRLVSFKEVIRNDIRAGIIPSTNPLVISGHYFFADGNNVAPLGAPLTEGDTQDWYRNGAISVIAGTGLSYADLARLPVGPWTQWITYSLSRPSWIDSVGRPTADADWSAGIVPMASAALVRRRILVDVTDPGLPDDRIQMIDDLAPNEGNARVGGSGPDGIFGPSPPDLSRDDDLVPWTKLVSIDIGPDLIFGTTDDVVLTTDLALEGTGCDPLDPTRPYLKEYIAAGQIGIFAAAVSRTPASVGGTNAADGPAWNNFPYHYSFTPRTYEWLFRNSLLENVAEFIVEWTDGNFNAIGVPESGLAWYGFPRDVNGDGVIEFWRDTNGDTFWGPEDVAIGDVAPKVWWMTENSVVDTRYDTLELLSDGLASGPAIPQNPDFPGILLGVNPQDALYVAAWLENQKGWDFESYDAACGVVPGVGASTPNFPVAVRLTIRMFGPSQRNSEGFTYQIIVLRGT
jgi:prepilin-type N-terminal cleavage/methylation domain-containing protein